MLANLINTCGVITCSKCAYPIKECICAKAKDPAAVKLGRKGGLAKSPRKQAAVRANVAKARAAKQKRQNAQPEPTVPNASQAE